MKYYYTFIFILFCTVTYGQSLNKNWQQDLNSTLKTFMTCDHNDDKSINTCHRFIGQALKNVYQINDFYSENLKRYLVVSEIGQFLDKNEQWKLLGKCYDQKTLTKAQNLANSGQAVVAVYINDDGLGHLSIILPGKLKTSGTWGLKVPNTSSFFSFKPENSYINKGLSYAFMRSQITKVKLYARNY